MSTTKKSYNENSIREAAYYCWKNAGCPYGQDEYFWNMAINQLYGTNHSSSCSCKTNSTSCSSSSSKKSNSSSTKKTPSNKK